jgi:CheY-like chemotaxis protein
MSKIEKPYVLIVDDNEATLTLVTALLQREFAVASAADGQDAIEKLRTKNFAAILLDLRMPIIDGFGVLEFLRREKPDALPTVIIVTASLTKAEVARVGEFPICGLIAKPFEIETLLSAVKACVGSENQGPLGSFVSSGMFLLLADILRQRLM